MISNNGFKVYLRSRQAEKGKQQKEKASVHWLTPQMHATARTGLDQSGRQGPNYMSHHLLFPIMHISRKEKLGGESRTQTLL